MDNVAPDQPAFASGVDAVGTVKGPIGSAPIDDKRSVFSGKVEANVKVTIQVGKTVLGTVTADANGEHSISIMLLIKRAMPVNH